MKKTRGEKSAPGRSGGAHILTINGGSSSIKFALFGTGESLPRVMAGRIERIGFADASFRVAEADGTRTSMPLDAPNHTAAVNALVDWLEQWIGCAALAAVGHRVVHGGAKYSEPEFNTKELVEYLRQLSPFDPEHLPEEIELTEAVFRRFPGLPQIACFDTAFHHDLPRVAQLLPIPRRLAAKGGTRTDHPCTSG